MEASGECRPSRTAIDSGKYLAHAYEIGRYKIIADLIPPGHGGLAADIGCGPGRFCQILSSKGWKTTAIDADRQNLLRAREYASEALLGDAVDVVSKLADDWYDFALALEIIEHMPRARGVALLENVRRVLKPGAALLLSTPNRLSLEGLGGYYWGQRVRSWPRWTAWDRTHVHIYSSWEIECRLRHCGFTVQRITGFWYEGRLPVIGRWRLPFVKSGLFPFNRLGFNTILLCRNR